MGRYDFMKGYTYILQCRDSSYYIGSAQDLRKRFWQHQDGVGANYTACRLPVKLVYYETYPRIDIAFKREKQLQGWSRKKKELLINGQNEHLSFYASCRNGTSYRIYRKRMLQGV
jgi:putative endonuclease